MKSSGLQVQLSRVNLRLGERPVLRNIEWDIKPGERWAVLGANGAGKTQLLKLVAGDVWPVPSLRTRRRYRWRDEWFDEPYGVKQEIAYVGAERQDRYQHYEWNLRVAAVVGTGIHRSDLPLERLTVIDRRRVQRLLRGLGIAGLASRRFLTLSYGQRRLVLLARALAWRPGLLLMDELLNGLDVLNREQVLAVIETQRQHAVPWVITTHRAEDIPASCTHLLLLDRGAVLWRGRLGAARRRQLQRTLTPARTPPRASRGRRDADGDLLISARNAWVWLEGKVVLRRLSFDIRAGDCWVVHGPNGSGKSTLIRALYGDLSVASQGELRRRGITPGVAISEFKQQVGLVAPELQTQHPLYLTAEEVVVSGLHSSIGLDEEPTRGERARARTALTAVRAAALQRRTLRSLSYGQMRRVLFARAAVHRPDILLLDEPYTGLDVATRQALRRLVDVVSGRQTIVITTHHVDEWPTDATHELQLDAGRAVYCGPVRPRRSRA